MKFPGNGQHLGDSPTPSGVYRALESTRYKLKYGSVLAGIVTLGTIGGGWLTVINVARSEASDKLAPIDAGMKSLDDRIDNTNERVDFLKTTLVNHIDEERQHHARMEQQQSLMMDALEVPKWRRPAPLDAGR